MEEMRRAYETHLEKYGSILYCPKRKTLCSFMDGAWKDGCQREVCIMDDPEYKRLKKVIEANRNRHNTPREEKHEGIRNQSGQCSSYVQRHEIHKLEEESQKAFRRNNPNKGHTLFNEARIKRYKLKEYMERKEG